MNQNEPIFLNLYIRDTESYCKDTKIVGNKQIMRVKKLISFYEILHFFSIFLVSVSAFIPCIIQKKAVTAD